MAFKVYLAGPISGLTFDECVLWRNYAKEKLAPEIDAYSPLRNKEFLKGKGKLEGQYIENPMSTDRGINTRDHFDVMTSDAILCNLLGTVRVSVGTVMEIAWAFAYKKPLILAIENHNNVHDHPMIREAIGFRTSNLDDAIKITRSVLLCG